MKEAVFKYKCRLCGETHDDAHTSEDNAQLLLPHIVYQHHDPPAGLIGVIPTLIATHPGCKLGYGVSDLIGYIIERGK